jgi:MFS family permease
MAILTSVFPPNERGRALGINAAAVYVGLSIGPPLGGFLTQYLGWRSVFYINIPLGLITLVAALWKLKGEWAEAKGEKFDLVGSIFYGLSLIALVLGFSKLPAMTGVWLVVGGTVGLFTFIQWEMRMKSPILNLTLFRHNTVFSLSNLAALINYMATNAVTFLLSLYLQYIKGLTPKDTGWILIVQPAVMAVLSPLAGRLSDRIEPRVLASLGMAVTTAGLGILGMGFALFSSPNSNAIMGSVDRKFYGIASGTLGTMRITGQMFSLGIATLLFSIYIGQVEIVPEYYPLFLESTKMAFIIFAALCFGGIFASLARGKTKR